MDDDGRSTAAQRIAALAYDFTAQPTEHVPECNLCGSKGRSAEVSGQDRYGYPVSCLVCSSCGLGYLSPRLSAEGYASFYSGVYRPLVSAYHGRRIDAETVQIDQRSYAAELVSFLDPLLSSSPRTILDVGGSTGVVAGVVAAGLGGRATVLDPAPDELAVARASGMEVVAGFVEDFDPGDRRWELVLLCQTIDHLLDVRATLSALRRLTAPGGWAFVDILDIELVLQRSAGIEGAVKIDHPYYLTGATAAAFFALAGYAIVAERLTGDGHRGFVLTPGQPTEPDWSELAKLAEGFVSDVKHRRAVAAT